MDKNCKFSIRPTVNIIICVKHLLLDIESAVATKKHDAKANTFLKLRH